jgi:hypothetical protein
MFETLSLRNVKRILRNPSLAVGAVNQQCLRFNRAIHQWRYDGSGTDIMAAEWDTLLILDGCRYDMFDRQNPLPGRLESRTSRGSQSWEFMRRNFEGGQYHDTVYVSANPYTDRLSAGTFHRVVQLYEDGWDPETETVLPETVVEATKKAYVETPNKRFVVHFMQPHFPFIGDRGRRLSHTGLAHEDIEIDGDRYPVWRNLQYGFSDISLDAVIDAYEENLDILFPHVERIIDSLGGKTVVTSDHGNLLGERLSPIPIRGYGHPEGIRHPKLTTVPWFVYDNDDRRDTVSDPSVETDQVNSDVIEQRLKDLGYV